jgi:hypothetical protein
LHQEAKERADRRDLAPARGAAQTPLIEGDQKPIKVARPHLVDVHQAQLLGEVAAHLLQIRGVVEPRQRRQVPGGEMLILVLRNGV